MVHANKGLEDVVIDESRVAKVDGSAGELWYRGYAIDDLVEESSFAEVLYLLWNDRLPRRQELEDFEEELAARRTLPAGVERTVAELAPRVSPMDTLRTAVSMLAGYVETPQDVGGHLRDHLLSVVSQIPTIVAQTYRHRRGLDVVSPRPDLGHAANFLYMLTGESPDPDRAHALDRTLILYAEHGMNASTFSAITTASTLANAFSSMTAAIGALQGPLHGGATETVTSMLEEIGDPDDVEAWVDSKLDSNERIPGFGHRVYQVEDPRCQHFQRAIEEIGPTGDVAQWYDVALRLREVVTDRLGESGIHPNTDLFSGIFYTLLDIPSTFYTTVFAMGRVVGWGAHVVEQVSDNRIVRPRVEYVGETGREYVPVDER